MRFSCRPIEASFFDTAPMRFTNVVWTSKKPYGVLTAVLLLTLVAGCGQAPAPPKGDAGPAGPPGARGETGPAGQPALRDAGGSRPAGTGPSRGRKARRGPPRPVRICASCAQAAAPSAWWSAAPMRSCCTPIVVPGERPPPIRANGAHRAAGMIRPTIL